MSGFDHVWLEANLATMEGEGLGVIEDGALAVKEGRIAWVGPRAALPAQDAPVTRCGGAWILPGLIDCHTHLVFGGNRAAEFEQRLAGATYEQIARAGGGIFSSVRATRAASEEELLAAATPRLQGLMAEGVTTVEIKSGYGLDLDSELKMLRVARRLGAEHPVEVVTSLLAAHAVPPDFPGGAEAYTDLVAGEILPLAARAGLADAVDAFCERIAFSPAQTERVFAAARAAGLPVKLHADQLSDLGGAALAARHGALSADHLEYASPAGLRAMAEAGTVAVLLPGATYFLREAKHPDIAAMRAAGVRMALSTDMNPGSSPARSLLLMLNLGCTLFRLTVEEALRGVTCHAAAALGLADRGVLRAGLRADFALYGIGRPAELCYWLGGHPCLGRVVGGR
ncbi:imidazolonepropionase [Roseomonas sp. GC11]|uniref:imidazolonepropionase n=1 Tax=Roseomonas sp. GC11 TaxID=2950546 RepID=UPI00210A2C5C|nr:imidazolonepropionase [Roseomonas sp. GC11]MCQ4160281.1 imidazolonepropionase [Roseomonas sp. GC11]